MNGEASIFGSLVPEEYRSSRAARHVMWAIVALHGTLLVLMLSVAAASRPSVCTISLSA
jgi:hypothetical protein